MIAAGVSLSSSSHGTVGDGKKFKKVLEGRK
jgi:hypothetical protein